MPADQAVRIRQIKPSFWTDPDVARLSDSVKLFYIGLWNVADDAGWLAWEPEELGALLRPYDSPRARARNIEAWGQALVGTGRLLLHECGCAEIPTLRHHQRTGGKPTFSQLEKHRQHGQVAKDTGSDGKLREGSPVKGTERNGMERNGMPSVEPRLTRLPDGTFTIRDLVKAVP